MIVLDYLAYQHRDEWEKRGFAILDVIGMIKLDLRGEKVVTARPVNGLTYDYQVYSDVEGGDSAKMAPFAVREIMPEVPVLASVEECAAKSFEGDEPSMRTGAPKVEDPDAADRSNKESSDETKLDVDSAFL